MIQRATLNDPAIIADDNGTVTYEHCANVARRDKCFGLVENRPAYRETLFPVRHLGQRLSNLGLLPT